MAKMKEYYAEELEAIENATPVEGEEICEEGDILLFERNRLSDEDIDRLSTELEGAEGSEFWNKLWAIEDELIERAA